ncbi:MAG TPA: aminoglycoside phosphotransferase family protein [Devosiaceae bacterium]|jgi:hygromycin-B 4-O-kinase|nr:aminoglycoside phosphotransferase family protein [Devosiaceae bacterium]
MKPVVDRAALEAEVALQLGERVALEPLAEGEESRVFGSGGLVVRVHPTGLGYAKDAFVAETFASHEVPVPRVMAVGVLENGLCYCVTQRAPGETLQSLEGVGLDRLVEPVARAMDAMARTDVTMIAGWGPFDATATAAFGSWREYLQGIADPEVHDFARAFGGEVPPALARLVDVTCSLAESCPEVRWLVHGDFGSNNVLADDGRITGIIDWSEAMVGDPLYDLANILFWRPWLDCMEQQARYFESERPERLSDSRRLTCYQLRIGLGELSSALRAGNRRMAEWSLQRCEETAAGL